MQLAHIVLGLAHHVGHALSRACTSGAIGNDYVFSRAEDRGLAAKCWIEVHLLERSASQAQIKQHAFMLWSVFGHAVNQLVVHVRSHALGCFFFEFVDRADDLRLDRTLRRKSLNDGLGLEANSGLSQQC